jgi:HK97 family phage major capsid protein
MAAPQGGDQEAPIMGVHQDWSGILEQINSLKGELDVIVDTRDARYIKRFEQVETSLNDLYKKLQRPGRGNDPTDDDEHKCARDLCVLKHELDRPKNDGTTPDFIPSHDEVSTAISAHRAMRKLLRHGNLERLDQLERKSLTSFSFGSNQFILAPQMSDRILSCLCDPTDVAGLMGQESCSGGSLKFLIDNQRMADAAWACEAGCFANNPQPDLQDGLGELEVKCETLRFVVCAGSDLLQDASFNIESWILTKASQGFRNTINRAVMVGSGIGMPIGILNPNAGIPVCDVAEATAEGQFTWQDLTMLQFELCEPWRAAGSYMMNARTFALLATMSDTAGRPLFGQLPSGMPGLVFAGRPVNIISWMPDVAPGSTPVAYGDWQRAYAVVNRKATTMVTDPFSAGFCTLYKFEARIGGGVLCPNAARLMRVR